MGDCIRMGRSPLRIRCYDLFPVAVAMPGSTSADTTLQLLPEFQHASIQWVIRQPAGGMDRRGTDNPAIDSGSNSVFTETE